MSLFTLEVAGRPVACIHAATPDEAKQAIDDPWFRDGLLDVAGDDCPVWRGDDEISVRTATPDELALVEAHASNDNPHGLVRLPSADDEEAKSHRLILASRVEHTPAFNSAGERIGHIDDLSIDRRSGAGYVVSLDRSALENAPHFDADELRELGGAQPAMTQIWEYYGRYGPPPI